jgi:hypothetical protein
VEVKAGFGRTCSRALAVSVNAGPKTPISSVVSATSAGKVEAGCRQATSASKIKNITNHLSVDDFRRYWVFILFSSPSY